MTKKYKISVLPGDGIGREVVPETMRTLQATEEVTGGFQLEFHSFECGGEYFLKHGKEWSEEAEVFTKQEADAILLGAVGGIGPDGKTVRRPDGHLAGYSVVIGLRLELELFANVRPVKLYEGVPCPLVGKDHQHINILMIRENTEGLYVPQEQPLPSGEPLVVIDNRVISREGSARVSKYAFDAAMIRNGAPVDSIKRVTCVDKSNLLPGCQLFRKTFKEVGEGYPEVERDYAYVDAFTQWLIRKPEYYDVVVAPNAFGDIITDLGGAIQGGLGMAPAGSVGFHHGVFEPVHGSAPKHYGQKTSNPIASILSGKMLLEWLGTKFSDAHLIEAANSIEEAITAVLKEGKIRTYDLCIGAYEAVKPSSTSQVTDAIISMIKSKKGAE